MNAAQMKSLLQLTGVTSIAYALYAAWSVDQTLEIYFASGSGQHDGSLGSQPFLWLGMVLVVAPYLAALCTRVCVRRVRVVSPVRSEVYFNCRSCGQPVPSSANVCPQCGEFQL